MLWVESRRIARENESGKMIPQQKEDVIRACNAIGPAA
jgi:hypothetical protein